MFEVKCCLLFGCLGSSAGREAPFQTAAFSANEKVVQQFESCCSYLGFERKFKYEPRKGGRQVSFNSRVKSRWQQMRRQQERHQNENRQTQSANWVTTQRG